MTLKKLSNKEKTYKEKLTEDTRGKKRFLERLADDEEALKEIQEFLEGREQLDNENYGGTD